MSAPFNVYVSLSKLSCCWVGLAALRPFLYVPESRQLSNPSCGDQPDCPHKTGCFEHFTDSLKQKCSSQSLQAPCVGTGELRAAKTVSEVLQTTRHSCSYPHFQQKVAHFPCESGKKKKPVIGQVWDSFVTLTCDWYIWKACNRWERQLCTHRAVVGG